MKPSKVMIVDDDRLLGGLLVARLKEEPGFQVVGHACSPEEALAMAGRTRPDVILLDVELPGRDGVELVDPLHEAAPKTKIIMLSSHRDTYVVHRVARANVQGYVDKLNPVDVVVRAVRDVLEGKVSFSPAFMQTKKALLDSSEAFHRILSDREQQVMRLVVGGATEEQIAAECKISAQTVGVHRKNIRRKLNLHSDRDIVAYARRWGIRTVASEERVAEGGK
jgi:DNA-binding NarL/FixJ family response regulator